MSRSEQAQLTAVEFKQSVLADYSIAYKSRQASLLGRKEVLTGKAKFGIFGDGKELPQIAMAKAFKDGDFRSGYYRDQTFMMAIGQHTVQEFFAQLYAHTDVQAEPASAGRMMNGHFGTRSLTETGEWKTLKSQKNSASDISPTAGQMLRLVGLAHASKYYRQNAAIIGENQFSNDGNEVAWGTIGNASSSEGHFFEAINAAGVLQIPMVVSVWDDAYGISVPAQYQTTKENISEILKGFQRDEKGKGFEIIVARGWNYPELVAAYEKAGKIAREEHVPVLVHVTELTQPQGHSTSGSHERYKSKERLAWELEHDCVSRFRSFLVENQIASESDLAALETQLKGEVNAAKKAAWDAYLSPIKQEVQSVLPLLTNLAQAAGVSAIEQIANELSQLTEPIRKDIGVAVNTALRLTYNQQLAERTNLIAFKQQFLSTNAERYNSFLFSQGKESALAVPAIEPVFTNESKVVDGREVMQAFFDIALERDARVFAFGEDVGKIGDVNQGFAGLQDKYGETRVFDTGIRELTIIGQGIGAAMRGLRPIAEIQYLDYLLYGLQPLSDDLATLQYRTKGGQKAPLIVRTRGHRLEGIWHSGSPIGMILHSLRGMHVLVPRNMVQAAGFYNTMLQSDEPALIIECLNGYRLKERLPENLGTYTTPLGVPEVLIEGSDITVVSYGSTLRIAEEAIKQLQAFGIQCELIDAQSLLPFDIHHRIAQSVQKTNKLVVVDEDVPGGASAYILQQILEEQKAFKYLDAQPITITAKAHRPPYGTDGDYFSKPSTEDIFEALFAMMHEYDPGKYPAFL
ncbi:MAG: thiamine pyrophosphate-dependent enzyme [Bacteroidia bacterium]|jgi:pyruvate/2-oxoglutarate/acetoin dehydrogenase E1 component/TPP-dependent pyruvate/acetoin dehydrogenase alpha subunit|nr:thiamine pyrophosphate-dependent enzyme [Bacteroidia bacterium]